MANPVFAAPPALTSLFPAGLRRGTTVEVKAAGTFDAWPCKVWVSGPGVSVEPGKVKGTFTITASPDAKPGLYFLRAYDDTGASGLRPFVVGTLPESVEIEPNDDAEKARPMPLPAVVNGRLEKNGDVDCFAVELKRGQTLVAAIQANRGLASPMDGVLQLLSADGFVLAQNHDAGGLDPRLAFTAPKDGSYIVRAFAFPAVPDASIRLSGGEAFVYRLTLTACGHGDYPWPLAVPAAAPGEVELVGWNLPASRKYAVPAAEDGFAVVSPPDVANPVRARVEPHPCYLVSDLAAKPRPLDAPFSASGRLKATGQTDVLTLTGKKGKPLTLQVESQSLGLDVTPVLRVLGPTGEQLLRAEPTELHKDVQAAFTPPDDGAYRVEVRDLFELGGDRAAYLLRVVNAEPDFDLTVPADRISVTVGKPTEVKVTVARKNGFAADVEVSADGLPQGVAATPVPPAGKPDPGSVVLRITAEKAAAGSPLRIVGRAKTLSAQVATASDGFGSATTHLWLNAIKSPPASTTPGGKP